MQSVIDFLTNNSTVIFASLFAISELLSLVPAIKSNGIFQLIFNFLAGKVAK
jgi:hypothetical protein